MKCWCAHHAPRFTRWVWRLIVLEIVVCVLQIIYLLLVWQP